MLSYSSEVFSSAFPSHQRSPRILILKLLNKISSPFYSPSHVSFRNLTSSESLSFKADHDLWFLNASYKLFKLISSIS
jgi:hypothetical protein